MERHSRREFLLIADKTAAASFLLACSAKTGLSEENPRRKEGLSATEFNFELSLLLAKAIQDDIGTKFNRHFVIREVALAEGFILKTRREQLTKLILTVDQIRC